MGTTKPNQSLHLFLLFSSLILLLFFTLATAVKHSPELDRCTNLCRHLKDVGEKEKQSCEERCQKYYKEKKDQESEPESESESEEVVGDISIVDKKKQLSQCYKSCERQGGEEKQVCRFHCWEKWGREKAEEEEEEPRWNEGDGEGEEKEEEEWNPYVFQDRKHFKTVVKTENGRVDVLDKFIERSELLRGIDKYRVAFVVAGPHTFVIPNHWDADGLLVVTGGEGVVTKVLEGRKESVDIEFGDILRIPAGTPVYITNTHPNRQLSVIKLLLPVNLPDEFVTFYESGGDHPESFYKAFSWRVLEAAFNTPRYVLENLFGHHNEGGIVKANKEQIKALKSHHGEGIWPFKSESEGAFNLFKGKPSQSNNFGKLFEARTHQFKPLQDFNIDVTFANITKGAMAGPYYNSRANKIAIVLDGEGELEMACPHLSRKRRGGYRNVRAQLWKNTVFFVPAGHPVAIVASPNRNLQVVCFEVNARGNVRYLLAGKENVFENMDKEAKVLAFRKTIGVLDKILGNQKDQFFFPGPKLEQGVEGRDFA